MNPGSVLSLATAEPGWTVTLQWARKDELNEWPNCPVVAWAVVVNEESGGTVADTMIEPVFIRDGMVWTVAEARDELGPTATISIHRA